MHKLLSTWMRIAHAQVFIFRSWNVYAKPLFSNRWQSRKKKGKWKKKTNNFKSRHLSSWLKWLLLLRAIWSRHNILVKTNIAWLYTGNLSVEWIYWKIPLFSRKLHRDDAINKLVYLRYALHSLNAYYIMEYSIYFMVHRQVCYFSLCDSSVEFVQIENVKFIYLFNL